MRYLSLLLLVLIATSNGKLAASWNAPEDAVRKINPVPRTQDSIEQGARIYKKKCASCHGKEGDGDGPTSKILKVQMLPFRSREVAQQTDGELFWKITVGKKPMPPFEKSLSDEERWHIVNWMRHIAMPPESNYWFRLQRPSISQVQVWFLREVARLRASDEGNSVGQSREEIKN